MSTLGVGLIGCGGMGRGLGKHLLGIEDARLIGAADVSPEALARALRCKQLCSAHRTGIKDSGTWR